MRLATALRDHRHLRGKRVLCSADGSPLRQREVRGLVLREVRQANLVNVGVHVLRHTFCSHPAMAMRAAPTPAIQELAGHWEIATTQRYMHLSPAAIEEAIRPLDGKRDRASCWRIRDHLSHDETGRIGWRKIPAASNGDQTHAEAQYRAGDRRRGGG